MNKETDASDLELLRRYVARKDLDALGTVLKRHQDLAFRVAFRWFRNRADAEDCVQLAFIKAMRLAAKFDPGKGAVSSWFCGIVVNTCRNQRRARTRRELREDAVGREATIEAEAQRRTENQDEKTAALVREAVDRLPEKYRTPLTLRYYEGLPAVEVAAALGQSEALVRKNLAVGLQRVKRLVAARGLSVGAVALTSTFERLAEVAVKIRAPVDLSEKVIVMEAKGMLAGVQTASVALTGGGKMSFVAAAVLVGAATVGGIVYLTQTKQPETSSIAFAPPSAHSLSVPDAASSSSLRPINAGRVVFKWTFENDPTTKLEPKEASQLLAQWSWEPPGPNGRRGSLVSKVEKSMLIFPFKLQRGPYLLEITAKPDRADSFCDRTSGLADYRILPCKHWRTQKKFTWRPDVARVAGAWFFENRFILFHDEQVTWLQSFKTDCAGARFTSTATNLRIEEIVIREFAPEDVPTRLRDPERLIVEENMVFAGESWTFDDGIPADLKIFGESVLRSRPSPWENRILLAAEPGKSAVVLLPTKAPDGPFSVTVSAKPIRRTDLDFGVFWTDGKNAPPAETYKTGEFEFSNEWREWTVLFTGRYALDYLGDAPHAARRPRRVHVFENPRPAEWVAVLLNNLSVEGIRLEVARPETMNADEEKIREMIKDAKRIPWRPSNGGTETLLEQ